MKKYFDAAKNRFLNLISDEGFKLTREFSDDTSCYAEFANDKTKLKLELKPAEKRFYLYRADGEEEELALSQNYLFDIAAGDDEHQAESAAYEFAESVSSPAPVKSAADKGTYTRQKKDKNTDESSAPFFVNRIPSIMPECREPLLKHKAHYETLLPNSFCEEVVKPAMLKMIKEGKDKKKINDFFELLSNHYATGDLNAKSIIVQTLLNSITREPDIEYVEGKISEDLKKAWRAGRKYIGKNVKPEKKSSMEMLRQYQAATLNETGSRPGKK